MNSIRRFVASAALCGVFLTLNGDATWSQERDGQTRWFKGNLHTHSLWSDGNDFPEMICDWYAQNDYNFLALSDHNILSRGEK